MSSQPPVDPKTIQNLRSQFGNYFWIFDNLEDFGPKILTFVLIELWLIVKPFDIVTPKTQGLTKKHPVDVGKSRSQSTSRQREDRAREAKLGFS